MFKEYIRGHNPVGHAPISKGAAMFRSPSQRFLSNPWHMLDKSPLLRRLDRNLSLALVARWPGRQGCMTKALTGTHCWTPLDKADGDKTAALAFEKLSSSASDDSVRWVLDQFVEREGHRLAALLPGAIKAVHSLAFVGMTELWNASISLFHHSFSKHGSRSTDAELFNMHKSGRLDFNLSHQELGDSPKTRWYDTSVLAGFWDEVEERVYAEAHERFLAEIESAKLKWILKGVPQYIR